MVSLRFSLLCLVLLLTLQNFALAQSQANAEFEITGVDNSEIRDNIALLLEEVTSPIGRVNQEKYKQSLVTQVKKAVQAYGYYDAQISIENLQFNASSNGNTESGSQQATVSYDVSISLGSKALVEQVVMVNDLEQINTSVLPQEVKDLIEQVKNMKGKAVDHQQYENLKNKLRSYSVLYGYFDFKFPLHKLIVKPDESTQVGGKRAPSTAIIHWIFYMGQRYKFGDVSFLSETRGQEIALSVKPFKKGDYFEQNLVGNYSMDMQSTNYFSSAIARANANQAEDFHVPIEVILDPKPKDTFDIGVGVSTDTGPRFTLDWTRPWVNLDGHSLGARLYLSRPRKSAELNYRIPKANPLNDFLNYQASFKQLDENDTRSDTIALAVQRQWGAEDEQDWDKIAFLRFEQETFTQGLADEQTTRLLLPGFTYTRTRKRGDIFVDWGDLQRITIEGGSKALLSDIDFFKVTANTKWIREYNRHRFVFRADFGAIESSDFSRVPSSQRFFAGGDQSIRGFGLDEVSSFNRFINDEGEEEVELLGGKYLAVASLEYAYPLAEKWRIATFIDAGNASDNPLEDYAYGVGVGVHWLSPIGTVRIYYARGYSDIYAEPTNRIHLVIGPGM